MEPNSPRHLVEQATAGDGPAVETLLHRFLPSVRAYLRLRAGRGLLDKESASDLAQSVVRDVLENLDRFRYDGEDGFRRWLFKTAQRKVLDRHAYYSAKKRAADAPPAEPGDLEATLACYGNVLTPSRAAIAREELMRVERAIDALPPEMREVVILSRVVGLSRRAVAEELGKTEGSVRMLLHRALARLGDRLADTSAE
jgi:RNA polymerase sigma-70 factor (ECF subfamily)